GPAVPRLPPVRRCEVPLPPGAGLLSHPPLHPPVPPLGLPPPGPQPRRLLPRRRRPLPRLARRPQAARLLRRHLRLLQGPRPPARGPAGPPHPGHRPAASRPGPARLALGGPHRQGGRWQYGQHARHPPQPGRLPPQPGLGSPIGRLVVVFSLAVGTVLDAVLGRYQGKGTSEVALFHTLHDDLEEGDILLADRYYGSYWELALLRRRGADLVTRLH